MAKTLLPNPFEITPVQLDMPGFQLHPGDSIASLGSCFADEIGTFFQKMGIPSLSNPAGSLYNPQSIANFLEAIVIGFNPELKEHNKNGWVHLSLQGEHPFSSSEELQVYLDKIQQETSDFLSQASHLVITLGTAQVWEHIESSEIVANCHRLPSKLFDHRFLTPQEISVALASIENSLERLGFTGRIIWSLSPIRHLRDNAANNSYSKALLRTALEPYRHKTKHWYFGAWELVMDEIRDYRFYDEDGIHLRTSSVRYIIQRFLAELADRPLQDYFSAAQKFTKLADHRVLSPRPEDRQRHFDQCSDKLTQIQKKWPWSTLKAPEP